MPSDRLAELQRQRALAQAQLTWIDQEIARELSQASSARVVSSSVAVSTSMTTTITPPPSNASSTSIAEEIAAQSPQTAALSVESVRRGCFIAFAIIMGTLFLGTLAVYLVYQAKR